METIRLTTAQALVKFLNQQYISVDGKEHLFVKGVFTIFGHGNVLGLGQALQEGANNLKVYQGRNEQGMVHVATGYAKQNNCHRIMACTSSVGPGAANMVTAAATATANNIPVLLLPGDVYASRQPDPVLQQIEQTNNLSVSTNDAFKAVCRYWDRITRPEQLMSASINAMRALTDPGNRGAVCLCLPQDVQGECYDYPMSFFEKRVYEVDRNICMDSTIQKAIQVLKNKKKPLIICGGGVKYSIANDILREFSSTYGIPIVETQAGKSAIIDSFPYNLGGVGVTGNSVANKFSKEADCVIAIGSRLTDFTTGSKSLFENPKVEFININQSRFQAMKYDGLALCGDAKAILEVLKEKMKGIGKFYKENEMTAVKEVWDKEYQRLSHVEYEEEFIPEVNDTVGVIEEYMELHGSKLTQTNVISYINDHIESNSIIVGASGSLPGCLQRMWRSKGVNTYHMEYGYSCMGYEIAAGLGAKMASPKQEVYVMVGDGSYQMLHSELATSLQINQKINIVLFDNSGFGCINNLQMENGMDSYYTEFRDIDNKFISIDYAASAAGYGVKTYTVKTWDELAFAIEDSKKQSISTLIDIKVLPKTMTHGYDSWWNVGVAQISKNEKIDEARDRKNKMFKKARKY